MARQNQIESLVKKYAYEDFFIEKELRGSYNSVYLAAHKDLRRCVLKLVAQNFYAKPRLQQKLEKEAIAMLSLRHEHIITGYGFVIEPKHVCLVYEFAEHGSLRDALRNISIAMALKTKIAYQISLAMNFLHNSAEHPVLHCNLKASNVFLTRDFTIKIGDFLSTKTAWMSTITQEKRQNDKNKKETPNEDNGTRLAHIPPESLQNINRKASRSTDVYAYGVILWELLTNKVPFEDLSASQVTGNMRIGYTFPYCHIQRDRPLSMFEVMDKSLKTEPEARPGFREISLQLKPVYEASSAEAKSAVSTCQKDYERFRVKIRDEKRIKEIKTDQKLDAELVIGQSVVNTLSQVFQEKSAESLPNKSIPFTIQDASLRCPSPALKQKTDSDSVTTQEAVHHFSQFSLEKRRSYFENGEAFSNKATPYCNLSSPVKCSSSTSAYLPPSYQDSVPRIPVLASTRDINLIDHNILYLHVGKEWKQLARVLGLFEGEIDGIDHDNHVLNEKIAQAIRKWKNRQIGANVGHLAQALIDSGLGFIAGHLTP